MNVEIGAETALFPEKEYINGIAVAVQHLEELSGLWMYIPQHPGEPCRLGMYAPQHLEEPRVLGL
jgi:hypothetical protein